MALCVSINSIAVKVMYKSELKLTIDGLGGLLNLKRWRNNSIYNGDNNNNNRLTGHDDVIVEANPTFFPQL